MRISTVGYSVKQGVKNIEEIRCFTGICCNYGMHVSLMFRTVFLNYYELQYIVHKAEEKAWRSLYFQ